MASNCEQTLADLPPSAKLVYYVIRHEGPLTQKAIADESLLPPRTVRYAINRLEDVNAITKRVNIIDARQRLYESDKGDSDTSQRGAAAADD